ncbi:MAG: conjugal transfer protein [Oscillospiraceae bacterium]|jgi:hypothetical protein|nr:conjugal transfer protein [Oscillospiraceae bacterium]
MAGRNQYTSTPGYGRQYTNRDKQPRPGQVTGLSPDAPRRAPDPSEARPLAQPRQSAGQGIMLFLVYVVQPICLMVAVFQTLFCWIFAGLSFVLLMNMWGTRCFAAKPRMITSAVMVVFILFTLTLGIVRSVPKDPTFKPIGGENPAVLSDPTAAINAAIGAGGDPAVYNAPVATPPIAASPTPRNAAFVGLSGNAPTAPIEAVATPAAPVMDPAAGSTGGNTADANRGFSAAESVLNSYMQMWQERNWEDMVQYTSTLWRGSLDSPKMQLYYTHDGWELVDWMIQADAQAPGVEAANLTVTANMIRYGTGEAVVQQYKAILYQENGSWYVDPNSMTNGMAVPTASPTANPASVQPNATPSGNIDPATPLWRNTKGGRYYHADEHCAEIDEKYWPDMGSFEYAELDASTYKNLLRCPVCDAPARP